MDITVVEGLQRCHGQARAGNSEGTDVFHETRICQCARAGSREARCSRSSIDDQTSFGRESSSSIEQREARAADHQTSAAKASADDVRSEVGAQWTATR